MRVALVVNTQARSGAADYQEVKTLLAERGVALNADHAVSDPAELPAVVTGLLDRGERLILVGGGDGSLGAVAGLFAYRDAVLGILPLGTANSLARGLGIPLNLDEAVEVALRGNARRVDLGRLNDRYFVNTVAIGLPAIIGKGIPGALKRWTGPLAYIIYGTTCFLRYRSFYLTAVCDGRRIRGRVLNVLVANGRYQGALPVALDAGIGDGKLLFRLIKGKSKANLLFWWASSLVPWLRRFHHGFTETIKVQEIYLETKPPREASVDGEIHPGTPIRITIAKAALQVKVPGESRS